MADYIDREELKKVIREDEYSSNALNMLDDILSMPSVDAVEVTRCEYCKHWDKHNNLINQCEVHQKNTGKFYFCASGVKKND